MNDLLLVVIGVVLGALLVFAYGRRSKRFGLNEAEEAARYASPEQAGTVLAVVVGVLGYEDTVVAELDAMEIGVEGAVVARDQVVARHERAIDRRRAKIEVLDEATRDDKARVAHAVAVAAVFGKK